MMVQLRRAVLLGLALLIVPACGRGSGGKTSGSPIPGNQPPSVSIVSPSPGATFTTGSTVELRAEALDPDGSISQVQFFRGATLLGADSQEPFQFSILSAADGSYSVTAVATDNAGLTTSSNPLFFTVGSGPVNQPPTVTLTSPAAGDTFPEGYRIGVSADAADPEGPVARVEFFEGSTSIGVATQVPFMVDWTASSPGTHSFHAVATDGGGLSTSSASVAITVSGGGGGTVVPAGDLRGVCFADPLYGWTVGTQGQIYATRDGGLTWSAQNSGTTGRLARVQFVSTTRGWVVGGLGTILSTADGGATWTLQSSGTTSELQALSFVSATTGWVVGSDSTILKTTNGGASWTDQTPVDRRWTNYTVSFVDALYGWIAGDGFVDSTTDGGVTWTRQGMSIPSSTDPYQIYLRDARFMSRSTGTLVGSARSGDVIVTTTDGGATWTRSQFGRGPPGYLSGVAFGDAQHVWAVGSDGLIVASADRGLTWSLQTSPTFQHFSGVWFVNATTGWAVGANGTVIRTTNGGATWTLLYGGT